MPANLFFCKKTTKIKLFLHIKYMKIWHIIFAAKKNTNNKEKKNDYR